MSQYHDERPRRRLDEHEAEETYSESELVEEMNKLDINSLLSSSPIVSTQQKQVSAPEPSFTRNVLPVERGYRSLNSIKGSPWNFDAKLDGTVQEPSRYHKPHRGSEGDRWSRYRRADEPGLSSELVAAIFRNITKTRGGKRFARLRMDDSGRWRVVHIDKAQDAFPS